MVRGWGIWADSWLPEQANFKVWSPVTILANDAKVCELIDPDTKNWRRDLVYSIFNLYEAKQIINIPISMRLPEDKLTWHWERDGEYSVKSAYRLLYEDKNRNLAESSNTRGQKLWKEIWKHPPKSNLKKKGMDFELQCPIRHTQEESQDHLFMHCQAT